MQAADLSSLPESLPTPPSEDMLQLLHKYLLEVDIEQGEMVCRNCSHVYPIKDGIPNMLLNESEV